MQAEPAARAATALVQVQASEFYWLHGGCCRYFGAIPPFHSPLRVLLLVATIAKVMLLACNYYTAVRLGRGFDQNLFN
jgi:hypothetical protein